MAQTAELPRRTALLAWSSGAHDGRGSAAAGARKAASQTIAVPGAPWLQVQFGESKLGRASRVEVTSLLDGATQSLDAAGLARWGNQSAYFNGDAVEVRLLVGPGDRDVQVNVSSVVVGEQAIGTRSLCGPDDRLASTESRVARVDPVGCTGWVVESGLLLTAGHCLATGTSNRVMSFNPPPSLANGTVQFPPPDRQFAVDTTSFAFVNGGVGNDWGIFRVFANELTGLQPVEAFGGFRLRQDLTPATIRITGFGVDTGVTNQTNQTHAGRNGTSSGTTMRYTADTTGGNSGSPVIDEATGDALGIHTHGGCSSFGGSNSGTSFFNAALWSRVAP